MPSSINPWTTCSVVAATGEFDPNAQAPKAVLDGLRGMDHTATRRQQILFLVLLVKPNVEARAAQGAARTIVLNCAALFLRPPSAWAPAEHVACECAFMPRLVEARTGVMTARRWRHITLPQICGPYMATDSGTLRDTRAGSRHRGVGRA